MTTTTSIYDRTYGVELEFIAPAGMSRGYIADKLVAAGVQAYDAGYSHQRSGNWKLVSDGSLTGGNGVELVSPVLRGAEGHDQIAKACNVLNELGCTVNRSCGLHVHVGANGMSISAMRKLAFIYADNEHVIDKLLPQSRRGSQNHYCNSITGVNRRRLATAASATEIAQAISNSNPGGTANRYMKLNYTSYWRHGTVEFRHHSGTVSADKVNQWVLFVLRMVKLATDTAGEGVGVAAASASVPSDRPRNRRLATIYDLMARPGGCTREDVAAALGRRTMPPLNRILSQAGIPYHEYTGRRQHRYTLVHRSVSDDNRQPEQAAPSVATVAASVASLTDLLAMPATEKNFWLAREAMLANATLNHNP